MEFIMVLRWLVYVSVFFITAPLAYIAAPFVALYSVLAKDDAPEWCYYLLTPDNTLDGDDGHKLRWPGQGDWQTWLRRTAWQWRNVLYNFRYDRLGVDVCPAKARWSGVQNAENGVGTKGWQLGMDDTTNTFSFFAFLPYPGSNYGIRMYLGWKYKNGQRDTEIKRKMLSFAINPFKKG